MSKDLLNTDGKVTNYWWDCPSCGNTKISSVLRDENGNILGATMCCPECFYVIKGTENTYVDETVYEIPSEWISFLEKPRWKCQQCGALNEKPSAQELQNLTVDDLYCKHCQTWQCDIEGTPSYDPDAVLKREQNIEKKSRWENPIIPVELKEDQENFQEKYTSEKPKLSLMKNKNLGYVSMGLISVIIISGLFIYDGLKIREVKALITNPSATVKIDISKYEIVKKEGWNPNPTAQEYKLISQFQKQDGTKQVPDGMETYYVNEEYIARYKTESYTETVTEKVQTGTKTVKGQCRSVKSGAVAKTECDPDRTEAVYETKTKEIQKTKEVPIYETRKVAKTRQKYRTEPVYKTWYIWQQGEWYNQQTLTANSNSFKLEYPNTNQFKNQPNLRIEEAKKECQVTVKPELKNLSSKTIKLECNLYEKLAQGDQGIVLYNKWGGIKDIKIEN